MPANPTAWGEGILEYGTPGTGDTLATTWTNMGCILDDTIGVAAEDGTALELRCWGNVLKDYMDVEKTFTITGTLVGVPSEILTAFWGIDSQASPTMTWVDSTITSAAKSFRISTPNIIGSDRLNVPVGRINLGLAYAQGEGFSMPFSITITKGATGHLFGFDTIAPEA